MGSLTAVAGVASLVAGVFAGVVVDRTDRRGVLIGADLARLVLYGVVPVVWAFGAQVWLLYVVLPLGAAAGMLFAVTYVTVVRALVGETRVTEANGRLNATAAAAGVVGPLGAGMVAGWFGPAAAIGVDAASFGVSALCLASIRLPGGVRDGVKAEAEAATAGRRLWDELRAGAVFLWRHPVLRALTVLLTAYCFFELGLNDILVYRLEHELGRGDSAVGTVFAVGALGSITGALLVAPVRRRLGFGPTWIGSVAVCGVAVACLGAVDTVPGIGLLTAVFLGFGAMASTCSMSLRQEVTPEQLLGRVTSAYWTLHNSAAPIGAVLLTWVAQHRGAPTVALLVGVCFLLIAGLALLTPVRAAVPRPTPADHGG
ncbi:major facilitator superfamily MFS_1 [Actinobacteria bacterium OK074]|nr:major facilitator superfamily MFS_1 [Actinobacteria bacterium OK074]